MKKAPVILVFVILLVLFCSAVFVYPKLGVESTNIGFKYMDSVFDQSQVSTVDIEMTDEDYALLIENAADEELYEANVTVNGTTVNAVAVRTKGNLSLRSVIQMEDSERYSFKIDFDYYDSTKSLDGLKKLNLNNNYSDASQMREYMSYKMMDELGIATPGYSYMYVTINGEERGLYLGVEAIEETFLARTFDKGSDSLYKPDGIGSDLKYISDEYDDYTGIDAKTEISSQDEEEFIDFITAINEENADLESILDVDEMLRYFAANTALVNLDSYQGNMKHNYYLYEEDGIFSILPWDYNMALAGFGADMGGGGGMRGGQDGVPGQRNAATEETGDVEVPANEDTDDVTTDTNAAPTQGQDRQKMGGGGMMMGGNAVTDSNINFSVYEPVSGMTMEERPLVNALLSNEEYVEIYEDYISTIANSFLEKEKFTEMVNEVYTLIESYVEKDPTAFYTAEEFKEDVYGETGIIEFASQRSDSILAQVSGELLVENTASSTTGGFNAPSTDANAIQGIQPPNGGQMPEGVELPEGFEMPGNGEMPELPEGFEMPEDMQGGDRGDRQMPGRQGGGGPGFGREDTMGTQSAGYSKSMIITFAVSIVALLILTFGISRFKRRGRNT